MSNRIRTLTDFIAKAEQIHGKLYGYEKFVYAGTHTKGIIICRLHGDFLQAPNNHMSNAQGCPKCANIKIAQDKFLSLDIFLQRAKLTHGDRYDYSKTVYTGICDKTIIICRVHGEFLQSPNSHYRGEGCPKCAGNQRRSLSDFIKAAKEKHGDEYDYSKFVYKSGWTKGIIICKIHGEFKQSFNVHIRQKSGCPKCYGNLKPTKEEYIEKANIVHGNKYDYSKLVYVNGRTPAIIICKQHGEFKQKPENHLNGNGCRKCKYKNEQIVDDFLRDNNIHNEREFEININGRTLHCDFYIPHLNLIIEYNGRQHYEPCTFATKNKRISKEEAAENFIQQQIRDNLVKQYCKENNVNLLEIDGREYYRNGLKKYLMGIFGNNMVNLRHNIINLETACL